MGYDKKYKYFDRHFAAFPVQDENQGYGEKDLKWIGSAPC